MEVLVEYDYVAEEQDELTIRKGEIIKDVSPFEEGWYIGCLHGKLGVFPDNFVKILSETGKDSIQNFATVETVKEPETHEANSNASTIPEAAVKQITVSNKPKRVTGVGLGNIFSGAPIQLKETSLKEVLKETDLNGGKTINPNLARVRVLYPYEPTEPDELELQVDDVIEVLNKTTREEGWWHGKNLRSQKVGYFPDNFIAEIKEHDNVNHTLITHTKMAIGKTSDSGVLQNGNTSKSGTSASTYTGSTLSEPPKVAVKPSTYTLAASKKSPGTKIQGNCDIQKSTMNNIAGRFGPTKDITPVMNNRALNAQYRVAPDLNEQSGSHRDEPVKYPNTSPRAPNSDSIGQLLTGPTADRPKQSGRRLPSRFAGPNNTSLDNQQSAQSSEVRRNKSTIKDDISSNTDASGQARANNSRRIPDSTAVSLERSEGVAGSIDLVRTADLNHSANKAQSQSQITDAHGLSVYTENQIKDIFMQMSELKQANNQLRSELVYVQQILTERMHSLMNELDEVRKQRASDAVELARLRKVIMQLDSKVLRSFSSATITPNTNGSGKQHHSSKVDFQAGDSKSLRDEEVEINIPDRMIGDS